MEKQQSWMTEDADDRKLERAAIGNHRDLFRMNAEAMDGEVCEDGGLVYTYDAASRNAMACWMDDAFEGAAFASEDKLDRVRGVLDRMMAFYKEHPPKGIGWWSLDPPQPEGIGALLLARGFQPGWQPCWMVLDLGIQGIGGVGDQGAAGDNGRVDGGYFVEDHSQPEGLEIVADNELDPAQVKDLPYAGDHGAVSRMLMKTRPGVVRQFIARWHGKVVGHAVVVLNDGELGVAGMYNVAVQTEARERGVGKALVVAGCRWAREKGRRYVTLNATGRRMYSQVGFRWVGDGSTWWVVNEAVFGATSPNEREVALAEAVGMGNIARLERLKGTAAELDQVLSNKLSLIQVAIYCKQVGAAKWLVDHGAGCSVLEAWDLGWKERAGAMLAAEPALVNMRYGEGQTTLMHIAADRGDMELARMALVAGPDMSIRDRWYKSTPLDWAKFFKREEILEMFGKS